MTKYLKLTWIQEGTSYQVETSRTESWGCLTYLLCRDLKKKNRDKGAKEQLFSVFLKLEWEWGLCELGSEKGGGL